MREIYTYAFVRTAGELGSDSGKSCARVDGIGSAWALAVADFPVLEFSGKKVLRAGEALKGELLWSPQTRDEIIEIFGVANSWRDSHALPMSRIRSELTGRISYLKLEGITVARVKKMPSIRKKLSRLPYKLNQIQDLGGARAILPSMEQAQILVNALKLKSKNEVYCEDDYIVSPKPGGYRSHHLVFKYVGDGDTADYDGRRIEVQVRTRLQHAWATAVEAAGLLKNQDMKAGEGDQAWLRLFELVSAEFALAENCPLPPSIPDRPQRLREIRDLNKELGVVEVLDSLRYAARALDRSIVRREGVGFYLVEFDHENRKVDVRTKFAPRELLKQYGAREIADVELNTKRRDTVFIEAGKVEDLKTAYPNYFGDFQVFITNLQRITGGERATEFTMPPGYTRPRTSEPPGDASWLRPGRHRRWADV